MSVELWELNRTRVFQAGEGRLQHYSMLLDETQERLIIGGKDILYSLNLERVTAPHKEVHAFIAVLRIWATCLSGIVICVCVCMCGTVYRLIWLMTVRCAKQFASFTKLISG